MMTKWRYTVINLASGQTRPYGPTLNRVQVLFEITNTSGEFEPSRYLSEERAIEIIKGLKCGYTDFVVPSNPSASDYYKTRLNYFKFISEGLYEFQTTSEYTD